jgi:hypothetical protein
VAAAPLQVLQARLADRAAEQEIKITGQEPVEEQEYQDRRDKVTMVEVMPQGGRVPVQALAVAPEAMEPMELTTLVAMEELACNRQLVALRLTMQVVDMELVLDRRAQMV